MQATFLFVVSLNSDPLFLFSYFVFLYTFVSCVDYLFRAIFFLLIYIFFLLTTCSFFLRLVLLRSVPWVGGYSTAFRLLFRFGALHSYCLILYYG